MRPHFWIVALLAGCGAVQLAPNSYEWFRDNSVKSVWYRWKKVDRDAFLNFCGFVAPDHFNGGGACAIRVAVGAVNPGDRNIYTGEVARKRMEKPLCLVFATMDEEEAKRMLDKFGERDMWSHEVVMHCQRGLDHKEVRK